MSYRRTGVDLLIVRVLHHSMDSRRHCKAPSRHARVTPPSHSWRGCAAGPRRGQAPARHGRQVAAMAGPDRVEDGGAGRHAQLVRTERIHSVRAGTLAGDHCALADADLLTLPIALLNGSSPGGGTTTVGTPRHSSASGPRSSSDAGQASQVRHFGGDITGFASSASF